MLHSTPPGILPQKVGKDPSEIAAFQHWYRGDLGVTGDPVTAVADQIGSANLATNGSPAFLSSIAALGGKPGFDCDGSDDEYYNTSPSISQPWHVFIVFVQNTWTDIDTVYECNVANGGGSRQRGTTPIVRQQGTGGAGNDVSPTLGTGYLMQSFFSGASSFQALNNDAASSGTNVGTVTVADIFIGSLSANRFCDMAWAEFAVANAEITGTDLTDLKDYFNNRYGVW